MGNGIEAAIGEVCDPEWLHANAVSFQLNVADNQAHLTAAKWYASAQLSAVHRAIYKIIQLVFGLMGIAAYLIALAYFISPKTFETPHFLLIAGAAMCVLSVGFFTLLATFTMARLQSTLDIRWLSRTIHTGIRGDKLWIYNTSFLVVFSSKSFVDVIQIDNAILAVINKAHSQWFPREKLILSEQGRAVLDWFATRWPDCVDPSSKNITPYVRRPRKRRWRIWLNASLVLLLLAIVVGFYESWRHDRDSFSTVCQFPNGWHDYVSSRPLKIGSLCANDAGAYGRVVSKGVGPGI